MHHCNAIPKPAARDFANTAPYLGGPPGLIPAPLTGQSTGGVRRVTFTTTTAVPLGVRVGPNQWPIFAIEFIMTIIIRLFYCALIYNLSSFILTCQFSAVYRDSSIWIILSKDDNSCSSTGINDTPPPNSKKINSFLVSIFADLKKPTYL